MLETAAVLYAQKHVNRRLYESGLITAEIYERVSTSIGMEIDALDGAGSAGGHEAEGSACDESH